MLPKGGGGGNEKKECQGMHSPSIPEGMTLAPGVQMLLLMSVLQSHEVQRWEPQSSLQAAKRM